MLLFSMSAFAGDAVKPGLDIRYGNFLFEPHTAAITLSQEIHPFYINYAPALAPQITFGNRLTLRAGASMDIMLSAHNKIVYARGCGPCGEDYPTYFDDITILKPALGLLGIPGL